MPGQTRSEFWDNTGLAELRQIVRSGGVATFQRFERPGFTVPVETRPATQAETDILLSEEQEAVDKIDWANYKAWVNSLPGAAMKTALEGFIRVMQRRLNWE